MNKLTRTVKEGEHIMGILANLLIAGISIYAVVDIITGHYETWFRILGMITCAVVFANCLARVIVESLKILLIYAIRRKNEVEKSN